MKLVYECIEALDTASAKYGRELEFAEADLQKAVSPLSFVEESFSHSARYVAVVLTVMKIFLDQLIHQNVFCAMDRILKFKPKKKIVMPQQALCDLIEGTFKHPNGKSYNLDYVDVCNYINSIQRCSSVQDALSFDIYTLVAKDKLLRNDECAVTALSLISKQSWLCKKSCSPWLKQVKDHLLKLSSDSTKALAEAAEFFKQSFATEELRQAMGPLLQGYDVIGRWGKVLDDAYLTDTGKAWLFTRPESVDEVLYKAKGFAWLSIEDQKRTKGRLKKLLPSTSSNECMLMSSTLTDLGKELLEEAESEYDESDKEKMLATCNSLLSMSQMWLDAAKRRLELFKPEENEKETSEDSISEESKPCSCKKKSKADKKTKRCTQEGASQNAEDSPTKLEIKLDFSELSKKELWDVEKKLLDGSVRMHMLRGEPYYEDGMTYAQLHDAFFEWAEREIKHAASTKIYSDALGCATCFMKDINVISEEEAKDVRNRLFNAVYH